MKLTRHAIAWLTGAVSLVVGALTVAAGWGLLPPLAAAAADGETMPWLLTWGFVWMTAAAAVVLAGVVITESE